MIIESLLAIVPVAALILMPPKRRRGGGGHRVAVHSDNSQTHVVPAGPPRLDQLPFTPDAREDAARQSEAARAAQQATHQQLMAMMAAATPGPGASTSSSVITPVIVTPGPRTPAGIPQWTLEAPGGVSFHVNDQFRRAAVGSGLPNASRFGELDVYQSYSELIADGAPITSAHDPRIARIIADNRPRYAHPPFLVRTILRLQSQSQNEHLMEVDRRRSISAQLARLRGAYEQMRLADLRNAAQHRQLCIREMGLDPDIRQRTYTSDELDDIAVYQNTRSKRAVKSLGCIIQALKREVLSSPETYPQIFPYRRLQPVLRIGQIFA
jgi:hypothetical protein